MESFWGILKTELVHHRRYATRQQAINNITEYIEVFYNRQRRQKRLGFLSPASFEKKYYDQDKFLNQAIISLYIVMIFVENQFRPYMRNIYVLSANTAGMM